MIKFILLAILGIAYLVGAALPPQTLWFEPGVAHFSDAEYGTAPKIDYTRHIKRPTQISYSVVVRNEAGEIRCEGRGGPFTYQALNEPLIGKDLVWWAAGDPRCGWLPVGVYWAETNWTVETPIAALLPDWLAPYVGWLLPPKRINQVSNSFRITER